MISIIPISGAVLALYWLRYLIWKRKDLPWVIPVLFTCFFLPKVNLLKVSGLSTAGIRVDDFIALGLLIIAVVKDREILKNRVIRMSIGILIALSVSCLLSVAWGRFRGYDNQILYSIMVVIRKFEYFAFALVGFYAVRKLKDPYKTFMDEFTLMSILHVLLAMGQVLGKVTYAVSGSDASNFFEGAAVSTFNGYYEYGMFLCFGCAVFMCDFLKRKNWLSFIMIPVSLGMLFLSNSRSSLVVGLVVIVLAIFLPIRSRVPRTRLVLGGYGLLGVLLVAALLYSGLLGWNAVGRFGNIRLDEFFGTWRGLLARGNFRQYVTMVRTGVFEFDAIDDLGYLDKISDWSAATRMLKWGAALDGFRLNPLLGYGSGVTHVMDGNYVRLLGETGILGTVLWFTFYGYLMHAVWKVRHRTKLAKALLLIMLSVLLNSLMIDMFDASKPMEMMWLLVGAVVAGGSRGTGTVDPQGDFPGGGL